MDYPKVKLKKPSREKLIKLIDEVVSDWVVLYDGLCCVICGATSRLTCSHLFKRGHYATRWDKMNIFGSCAACNNLHNYDQGPLTEVFLRRYSAAEYSQLHERYSQTTHFKGHYLEEMLLEWRLALVDLITEKNISLEKIKAVKLKVRRD